MDKEMTPARIKSIRQELRLSQEALARELGISAATVNRWENGRNRPGQMATRLILMMEEKVSASG